MTAVPVGNARQQDASGPSSWLSRHAPKELSAVALEHSVRCQIEAFMSEGAPHSLLLYGPPGSGKTTISELVVASLFPTYRDAHVFCVSASETRSVEFIRSKVVPWVNVQGGVVRALAGGPLRTVVVFSEADGLTGEAQDALKDLMERFADKTTFIFTTNFVGNLSEAIRSRCKCVEVLAPPLEERVRVLTAILAAEGKTPTASEVVAFASAHEDMRDLIRGAQDSYAAHGVLRLEPSEAIPALWHEPVNGCELLDGISAEFARYLALPEGAADTLALWVVFAHVHEAFGYSPILAAISPVKRSGKTRLFEVLSQLVPAPVFVSNVSPASIYRLGGPTDESRENASAIPASVPLTLLADEGDTWINFKPELRGIINSGHTRRAAFVIRVLDRPTRFSTFFPKALALIDSAATALPPTVEDRAILIPMRRRRHDEVVYQLRSDRKDETLEVLKLKAVRWGYDWWTEIFHANPEVPEKIGDRATDNWRPLLAVALVAGGAWVERARRACLALSGVVDESGELTVLLLRDISDTFDVGQGEHLPTMAIIDRLWSLEDRPWKGMLTPFRLAQMLRPFGIGPKPLWAFGGRKQMYRGYARSDFADVFARYL